MGRSSLFPAAFPETGFGRVSSARRNAMPKPASKSCSSRVIFGPRLGASISAHAADVNGSMFSTKHSSTPSARSEEHTSELQSRGHLVCRLLLEKKNKDTETN